MHERFAIMVVDDNADTRESAAMLLEAKGYATRSAASADEALALAAEAPPDLFILDVQMPGISGLDLLRALDVQSNDYEAVIITGHQSLPDAQKAMELGARSYLTKPINSQSLFEHVDKALGKLIERREASMHVASLRRAVSEREEDLSFAQRLLEHKDLMIDALFRCIGEGLVGIDVDGYVVLLNPAAERILGVRLAECIGRRLHEVVDNVELRLQLKTCLYRPADNRGTLVKTTGTDGAGCTYLVRVSSFHDRAGGLLGQVLNLVDQTEAVRSMEHRDSFLTMLAHELRTPVSIIYNYTALLNESGLEINAAAEIVRDIYVTSRRLGDLINGIISLATVTGSSVTVHPAALSVADLVAEEIERRRGDAEDHQVLVEVQRDGIDGMTIVSDPKILATAVGALLSSGIRSVGAGGVLTVGARVGRAGEEETVELWFGSNRRELLDSARRVVHSRGRFDMSGCPEGMEGVCASLFLVTRTMELLGGCLSFEEKGGNAKMVLTLPREVRRRNGPET